MKEAIKKTVGDQLAEAGFSRKGSTWWKASPEVIAVATLQKSNYSELFYLNLGFFIRAMDPAVNQPPENLCHVRGRAADIFKDSQFDQLLDLGNDVEEERRIEGLATLVREQIVPFLVAVSTEDGLKAELQKRPDSELIATKIAREHLLGS